MKVNVMHISMQRSYNTVDNFHDAEAIFDRAKEHSVLWITGTEDNRTENSRVLRISAGNKGYRFYHQGGGVWVALDLKRVVGTPELHFIKVIDGKSSYPDRGVLRVSFDTERLGRITVLASHYNLAGSHHPNAPGNVHNIAIAEEIGGQALHYSKNGLVFYGGNQNLHDEKSGADTFYGQPFTSIWDAMKYYRHAQAGRENVDVIASYNHNRRIKPKYVRAFNSNELELKGTHFLVEAGYEIRPLPRKLKTK